MPTALQAPTVGPIVGHVTDTQCRVFFRGDVRHRDDLGSCHGAARCRRADGAWGTPVLNKLSPNFDLTGVFVFDGLAPGTRHEYQVGWFIDARDLEDLDAGAIDIDWTEAATFEFDTAPQAAAPRSYVIGSCRYLLRLFGGDWFDDRGDKVFRSVLRQIEGDGGGRPVHALMMMGDQVYADDLAAIAPDRQLDDFLARYRTVFSQPHLGRLMSRVPTYMILDDHEIEDNWPSKASESDRLTLYPHAIHAYQIYQCSHGPLFRTTPEGRIAGTLEHFWYTFSDATTDWFVLDTRTERNPSTGQMIGAIQMTSLLEWLADGSGRFKFIVSSVPMFPDLASDNDDKWGAFPGQRKEILDFIFSRRIPKVVVLSGDVHTSFSCTLQAAADVQGNPGHAIHGVVSSSFFWPYPHMARASFLFDRPLANMGIQTLTTRLRSRSTYGDDNFTRLDVSAEPQGVQVSIYDRKGQPLEQNLAL